jgi:hypothetical protein
MAKATTLLLLVLAVLTGLAAPAAASEDASGGPTVLEAAAALQAAQRADAVAFATERVAPAAVPGPTAEADDTATAAPEVDESPAVVRVASRRDATPSTTTTVVVRDDRTNEVVIHGVAADVLGPAVTIEAERPTEVLGLERTRSIPAPGPAAFGQGQLALTGRSTDDLTAVALGLLALGTVCTRAARPRRRSRGTRTTGRPRWGGPFARPGSGPPRRRRRRAPPRRPGPWPPRR